MTQEAIRVFVEEHSPDIFGTRYSLRLTSADIENSPAGACVLRIAFSAFPSTPRAALHLYLIVSVSELSQLGEVLDYAVRSRVFEQEVATCRRRVTKAVRGTVLPFVRRPRVFAAGARVAHS